MRVLNIFLTGFFILMMSVAAQARMGEKMITCPSVNTIRQLAPLMKNAEIYPSGGGSVDVYNAIISEVEANGSTWLIVSDNIIVINPKEVADIAQNRMAKVTHMVYQNARKGAPRGDENYCLYYDGTQPNPFVSIQAIYSN